MHAATPTWTTLFIDFEPDAHQRGLAFWRDVTGYAVSATRGADDEFVTLQPPEGDGHLRVQRLGSGETRLHVDVHVADVDAAVPVAEELGAKLVERPAGMPYAVLTSPGGLTFCLVPSAELRRAEPVRWPGGHASIVDQLCLDIPPRLYDAEVTFWNRLTGWTLTRPTPSNEFGRLRRPPEQPVRFLLQRLEDDQDAVTAHLDLATTDRAAEVARHERLGARVVQRTDRWTVLADPTGWFYCVTDRDPYLRMVR
ncbi:VOC family protein [Pseudonocardia sp. CA-107938]|uniref:VOC family protein n=1 Tax=Pseudonocardia sp. CA-107938 TaxID=3240021 RepID=UPI003D93AD87